MFFSGKHNIPLSSRDPGFIFINFLTLRYSTNLKEINVKSDSFIYF